MLSLESALSVDGLTIYRDFNDDKTFFFAPPNPKVAREGGQPLFQLLIYRRDITDNPSFKAGDRPGGGFLTMTVDLKLQDALRNKILEQLKRLAGDEVNLRPIPFERGGVRVSVLGVSSAAATPDAPNQGPRFVENILASTTPSLYDDNRTVFSVELDHEGAQLMRASLEDEGASQIAVVYDLDFKGLMPAYKATIKIHFEQSYEHLRTRLTMNTLWFKADIDSEMEKLRKSGSIEITEIDFQGMAPEQQAAARDKLTQLAKDLATWTFFRPSITPGSVLAVDRGNLVAADPTAAASAVAAGFSQPLESVATGKGSPGGTAGPMLQGEAADSGSGKRAAGRPAPTGAGTPTEGGGAAATPAAEKPLTAVEKWNQAGRPQAAFLMRSLSQEERHDISYTMTQIAAVKQTIAPQGQVRLIAGDASLKGRIKTVDLNDPFFERIAGSVTTSAELGAAGVSSMVVKIRYGVRDDGTAPKDTAEFRLTQKGQTETYQFFMDRRLSVELEYQVVVNYKPGFALGDTATQATSPWKRTTTRNLDIDPAEIAVLIPVEITVAQMDWTAVTAVEARIAYQDHPDFPAQQSTTMFSQAKATNTVHLRPRDPRMRDYTLAIKYIFANGTSAAEEFKGSGAATFVINQPVALAVPVTVFSSDPLARFSKLAVELSFTPAAGPEQTKLLTFTGAGENQIWTLMRGSANDPVKYKYRVTTFAKNGAQVQSEWRTTQDRLLTAGDVFEELLEVTAQIMVVDFRGAGLAGVKLKLRYPDAAAGADDDKEFLFMTPPSEPIKWVVPKKPGGGESYEYTVTWIKTDGTQQKVGPLTSSDEVLLLHPGLEA